MNHDEWKDVSKRVSKILNGNGIYNRNATIKAVVNRLWYDHNIGYNDIQQQIMETIIRNDVMNRYDPTKSLDWFLVNVCWNVLKNIIRRAKKEARIKRLIKHGGGGRFGEQPPTPEELRSFKEMLEVAEAIFDEEELSFLFSTMTFEEFANEQHTSAVNVYNKINLKRRKCWDALAKLGYGDILPERP